MKIVEKLGLASCLFATLAMSSACATSDEVVDEDSVEAAATLNAYVLHLSIGGGYASIVSPGTPTQWLYGGSKDYAFLDGSTLTIKNWGSPDRNNCIMFSRWTGACAGQGTTCTLVIQHADLTTESLWVPIKGCSQN